MKRVVFITVLGFALCFSSYAGKFVAAGETYSALGRYTIELDDDYTMLNGTSHKPYVIRFENSDLEARVFVTMEKRCRKYFVLSDALSVQYVSKPRYFGVEKLDPDIWSEGYGTSEKALNKMEYFHQKRITDGTGWKKNKTSLVAAYFPMLLNSQEEVLASR